MRYLLTVEVPDGWAPVDAGTAADCLPEEWTVEAVTPCARPSHARNLTLALVDRVKNECRRLGVGLDTYDPDFIVGVAMDWLSSNDAALTGRGVRRFRR